MCAERTRKLARSKLSDTNVRSYSRCYGTEGRELHAGLCLIEPPQGGEFNVKACAYVPFEIGPVAFTKLGPLSIFVSFDAPMRSHGRVPVVRRANRRAGRCGRKTAGP